MVGPTQNRLLAVLSDGRPRSSRELGQETKLSSKVVESALWRLWKSGFALRTEVPLRKRNRVFKGRGGVRSNLRSYHLYILRPKHKDSLRVKGILYVKYKKVDKRGKSKSQMILGFLERNCDRAFYSKELVEALKEKGVKPCDIMTNVRRFERKGWIYVRGYRTHDRQTPFKEGYLLTWIDSTEPREKAIEEAILRTNKALAEKSSTSPIIERVHLIRDQIIEASKLRDLVSFGFLQNKLNCSFYEAEGAVRRALQLYPNIQEIKLFHNFRYYYHVSLNKEDLAAAVAMKENYIRMTKGRANRIGHNWEAVVEHFIDSFTTGARFWTQTHRSKGMDPRRITIHLLKRVGKRRNNAEVDRVWEVTPGPLLQPTTYVLECKWSLVRKRDLDDFFQVLRWSKQFGVDTPEGRQVKQGVIGVFAGGAFNPRAKVRLKDETEISLATYAGRMNIQLLKAADFNEKLRERGCLRNITVQKVCRVARDEKEVHEILGSIWKDPDKSEAILAKAVDKNKDAYEFEKMLEKTGM